ncbi:hypothetical protein [Pseudomonas phage PASB7]|nr:hypothetical protein [Pseudomonas phage PASB7]
MAVYLFIHDGDCWNYEEYSDSRYKEQAWEKATMQHIEKGNKVVRYISDKGSFRYKWATKVKGGGTYISDWSRLTKPPAVLIGMAVIWGIDLDEQTIEHSSLDRGR